jgi:hypothetical protein
MINLLNIITSYIGEKVKSQKLADWKPILFIVGIYLIIYAIWGGTWVFGDSYNYLQISKDCSSLKPIAVKNYVAACIYNIDEFAPLAVNTVILMIALFCLGKNRKERGPGDRTTCTACKNSKVSMYLSWYVLLCPQIVFRYWEPSKEFGICIMLLVCGILANAKTTKDVVLSITAFAIAAYYRPYAVIGYAGAWAIWHKSNQLTSTSNNKKGSVRKLLCTGIWLCLLVLAIRGILSNFGGDMFDDWVIIGSKGILGERISNPLSIVPIGLLNILGGLNVFVKANNLDLVTFVYFIDWLWRILLIAVLILKRRIRLLLYIVSIAILLASVVPFSHPRYLLPFIAFGIGLECGFETKQFKAHATI